jgi:hypothetical protein
MGAEMTRLLSHIFRFVVIAVAYMLAVASACAFALFLIWGGVTRGEPGLELPAGIAAGLSLPIVTAFAARYAFFPMLALIVWAEVANKRSWLFHALAGMAAGLAALVIRANDMALANPRPGIMIGVMAAGAVGGTVYWLIAGRNSGKNLDRLANEITSPRSGES